ncbi:MAG: hypothetical protein ACYCW6_11955 [Candidatus Xenobia bacterium]
MLWRHYLQMNEQLARDYADYMQAFAVQRDSMRRLDLRVETLDSEFKRFGDEFKRFQRKVMKGFRSMRVHLKRIDTALEQQANAMTRMFGHIDELFKIAVRHEQELEQLRGGPPPPAPPAA